MSGQCQVTCRRPHTGNNVSHSSTKTKRWFKPNIQRKRFYLPSENRYVRLTVSAKGIKVIDRRGIEAVVAEIRARGEWI
jgi:large subunit ribosomal protein L28